MRRALSSTDRSELLRAEQDVQARLHQVGIDVEVDFRSMAVVANVFRVASAARGHLERTVLAAAGLSFTAFTVMWVLWVWGEMEAHDLAVEAGRHEGDADRRRRRRSSAAASSPGAVTALTDGVSSSPARPPARR